MRFPYGRLTQQDTIGNDQASLTVHFEPTESEAKRRLRTDLLNGNKVKWPHARLWQVTGCSWTFNYDNSATVVVALRRIRE